jgi:hypothetical protein
MHCPSSISSPRPRSPVHQLSLSLNTDSQSQSINSQSQSTDFPSYRAPKPQSTSFPIIEQESLVTHFVYTARGCRLGGQKSPLNPFVVISHTPARDLNDSGIVPEGLKISGREPKLGSQSFLGPRLLRSRVRGLGTSLRVRGPCGNPVSPAFSQLSGTCSGSGSLCPDPQCHPAHGSHTGTHRPFNCRNHHNGKGLSCPGHHSYP